MSPECRLPALNALEPGGFRLLIIGDVPTSDPDGRGSPHVFDTRMAGFEVIAI